VAAVVAARLPGTAQFFVLDVLRERLSFADTLTRLRELCDRWHPSKVLVEKAASGFAVLETLRREIPGVVGVSPAGSKEARAAAVSPLFEAGQVFLPESAPWLADFIDELCGFGCGAKHDDQVDAAGMVLRELAGSVAAAEVVCPDISLMQSSWTA
jgi:predicted phage terminase large subunit-like protein